MNSCRYRYIIFTCLSTLIPKYFNLSHHHRWLIMPNQSSKKNYHCYEYRSSECHFVYSIQQFPIVMLLLLILTPTTLLELSICRKCNEACLLCHWTSICLSLLGLMIPPPPLTTLPPRRQLLLFWLDSFKIWQIRCSSHLFPRGDRIWAQIWDQSDGFLVICDESCRENGEKWDNLTVIIAMTRRI